ncbi:ABC transporter ATP-binding protein [Kaistia dalseonensis]|uniref:NitT/TauT family transport system ATP-binding protein n=1 Tax=Kaistia dalseonensis TaxID=410840 RepID=A0ABU0HBU3_9HYPH|nr:ABC transporter ATP-binding protein [Kaistia dalseonensis]MCX5496826.1 ABC transporter ATP-binding protein [Kaistia dalseonensis]MDQ0439452.1 NitT/TauT family transport system ATP-binding protein [Kaistia dalseonensis]
MSTTAPNLVVPHSAASAAHGRPIVRLDHISKTFSNGTIALKDMSLTIGEGEFVSLLGPSGCGKSTALRIIAGLGEATTGRVEWPTMSHDAAGKPEREIGFVFQEPTLMPWATVFKNVWLPLRLHGLSKTAARERVMAALEMVGLEKFADSYPRELSGGMKMRVSIARALVTRPRVLLMDEPFAALDEITRQKLNDDLLRLWEQFGWTIVFVTHSVFESVYLSSRIVIMAARPGRVIDELSVDAPHPRGISFRTSTAYSDYCRQASESLLSAIGANDHL